MKRFIMGKLVQVNRRGFAIDIRLEQAQISWGQYKQTRGIEKINMRDLGYVIDGKIQNVDIQVGEVMKILEMRRFRQNDLVLESKILYQYLKKEKQSQEIGAFVAPYDAYFKRYFRDINEKFREMEGEILVKNYVLGQKVMKNLDYSQGELRNEVQKYLFRFQRMVLSRSPRKYSEIYKQQLLLAKGSQEVKEFHPFKTIGRFIFQTVFFNQAENVLGEDQWPEQVNLKLQDINLLFQTLILDFNQSLLEQYTEFLVQAEEQKSIDPTFPQSTSLQDYLNLLTHISEILQQGQKHSLVKFLTDYAANQILINLKDLQTPQQVIQALSLSTNYHIQRVIENPHILDLINIHLLEQIKSITSYKGVDRQDLKRLIKYSNDQEQIRAIVLNLNKQQEMMVDIDIALVTKIQMDIQLNYSSEARSFYNNAKRMIIRDEDLRDIIQSEGLLQFLRSFKDHQQTRYDKMKEEIMGKIDEMKNGVKEEQKQNNLIDKDKSKQELEEIMKSYQLIIYGLSQIEKQKLQQLMENPKTQVVVQLALDVLENASTDFDAWLLEKMIMKFYNNQTLKEKLGATGETIYDMTEEAVIAKWNMMSDRFRSEYRDKIYED